MPPRCLRLLCLSGISGEFIYPAAETTGCSRLKRLTLTKHPRSRANCIAPGSKSSACPLGMVNLGY